MVVSDRAWTSTGIAPFGGHQCIFGAFPEESMHKWPSIDIAPPIERGAELDRLHEEDEAMIRIGGFGA